jgi:hypothetical protein
MTNDKLLADIVISLPNDAALLSCLPSWLAELLAALEKQRKARSKVLFQFATDIWPSVVHQLPFRP